MKIKQLLKSIRQRDLESSGGINYRAHWVTLLIVFVFVAIGVALGAQYVYTSINEGTFFVETHAREVVAETLSRDQLTRVLGEINAQQDRFKEASSGVDIPKNPFELGDK